MTCSTTWSECSSSKGPGVAETKTHWGTRVDELVEAQRPVVLGRGQAEAVLDQHVLARAVAGVLAVQLRHGHVALVDDAEVVLREEVEQRERRLPRGPAVEVPAVVLDPRADARLGQHLEVVLGADPEALRLEQLALLLELLEALAQLHLDGADGALDDLVAGDVVRGGVDGHVLHFVAHLAGQHVEGHDPLDGVAEQLDPQRGLLVGRVDLDRVAPGPERAPDQVDVVAGVLQVDQASQDVTLVDLVPHPYSQNAVGVLGRRAQAVDARDGRHHDDVAAHEERRGGGVAQPVDLVVDGRVLLDVGVRRGQVGLGLVVVVVGDEELDPVLREQLPQLRRQLGGQRLVRLDDEGRPLDPLDHPGDGGRLARAGDPLQRLVGVSPGDPLGQAVDGLRLVARRPEWGDDLELGHGPPRLPGRCVGSGVPPALVAGRRQPVPQRGHLGLQRRPVTRVVEHVVGVLDPLLPRDLRSGCAPRRRPGRSHAG